MFKSSCNRFDKTNKEMPGPASYKYLTFYLVFSQQQLTKSVNNLRKMLSEKRNCQI